MKNFLIAMTVLLISNFALCNTDVTASPNDVSSVRFSGVPAIGFDPDSGFGGGIIGRVYVYQDNYQPYKMAFGMKAYLSTKGMNSHELTYDSVRAFDLPLRLTTRLGFYSTRNQNYCGLGALANCDPKNIDYSMNRNNFSRSEFAHHYFHNRFMTFFGDVYTRWLLWQDQAKFELLASYRGRYYLNRDFKNKGPYPGSLFDQDFSSKKNDGYLSTAEIGVMLDKRDNEVAPTAGYWFESTVRGGSWLIGSAWDYFGANASFRYYYSLDEAHRFVLASQTILDAVMGDLPYDAISRLGGSSSVSDYLAIGGQYIGRGMREQLYVGKLKAIEQIEARIKAASFKLGSQNFDLVPTVFTDFGVMAKDFSSLSTDITKLHISFGTGLRIHWNDTFVIRADLGFSPAEKFSPQFYLITGNVF